jgi:intein-encoded DNA endonuclease-like protein
MTTIINSIKEINPNAEVSVINEDVNQITWHNGTTPILANEILAKQQELIAEYNSKQYQRDRAKEYPDFKDYLDGIVKGDQAQIDKYIADCLAVKAKYPKE